MTENERVYELRKSLDLTLEKFGERLGVTKVAISNIENGKRNVTEQMKRAICREFNVSIAWLEEGIGDMFTNLPETLLDELANEYNLNDQMKKLIKTLLELDENSQNTLINILEKTFSK